MAGTRNAKNDYSKWALMSGVGRVMYNYKDRYMLNAALSYDVLDWLNVSGRLRIDNSNNDYTEKFYASTFTQLTEGSKNGLYGITKTKDKQVYGDVLVNINRLLARTGRCKPMPVLRSRTCATTP